MRRDDWQSRAVLLADDALAALPRPVSRAVRRAPLRAALCGGCLALALMLAVLALGMAAPSADGGRLPAWVARRLSFAAPASGAAVDSAAVSAASEALAGTARTLAAAAPVVAPPPALISTLLACAASLIEPNEARAFLMPLARSGAAEALMHVHNVPTSAGNYSAASHEWTALFLLAAARAWLGASALETGALRPAVVAAAAVLRSRIRRDGFFVAWSDPSGAHADARAAAHTVLALRQAQVAAGLRAAAGILGDSSLAIDAARLVSRISDVWDAGSATDFVEPQRGVVVERVTVTGSPQKLVTLRGLTSELPLLLLFLEPGDIPPSAVARLAAASLALETPLGLREAMTSGEASALFTVSPTEQAAIALGAAKHARAALQRAHAGGGGNGGVKDDANARGQAALAALVPGRLDAVAGQRAADLRLADSLFSQDVAAVASDADSDSEEEVPGSEATATAPPPMRAVVAPLTAGVHAFGVTFSLLQHLLEATLRVVVPLERLQSEAAVRFWGRAALIARRAAPAVPSGSHAAATAASLAHALTFPERLAAWQTGTGAAAPRAAILPAALPPACPSWDVNPLAAISSDALALPRKSASGASICRFRVASTAVTIKSPSAPDRLLGGSRARALPAVLATSRSLFEAAAGDDEQLMLVYPADSPLKLWRPGAEREPAAPPRVAVEHVVLSVLPGAGRGRGGGIGAGNVGGAGSVRSEAGSGGRWAWVVGETIGAAAAPPLVTSGAGRPFDVGTAASARFFRLLLAQAEIGVAARLRAAAARGSGLAGRARSLWTAWLRRAMRGGAATSVDDILHALLAPALQVVAGEALRGHDGAPAVDYAVFISDAGRRAAKRDAEARAPSATAGPATTAVAAAAPHTGGGDGSLLSAEALSALQAAEAAEDHEAAAAAAAVASPDADVDRAFVEGLTSRDLGGRPLGAPRGDLLAPAPIRQPDAAAAHDAGHIDANTADADAAAGIDAVPDSREGRRALRRRQREAEVAAALASDETPTVAGQNSVAASAAATLAAAAVAAVGAPPSPRALPAGHGPEVDVAALYARVCEGGAHSGSWLVPGRRAASGAAWWFAECCATEAVGAGAGPGLGDLILAGRAHARESLLPTFLCPGDALGVPKPCSYLLDDYCDCADGSDEPRTAACEHGLFRCRAGAVSGGDDFIRASRVRDGVRDCLDGEDEADEEIHPTASAA